MARTSRLLLMRDHVGAIYRTLTGAELPESDPTRRPPSLEELEQRFWELEALIRSHPPLAERVPPFSFVPPVDLVGTQRELVLEVAVPGVERGDLEVALEGSELTVQGARAPQPATEGQICFHAEIARGPFRRVIRLPEPTTGAPRVEVEHGIIRIKLARATKSPRPSA